MARASRRNGRDNQDSSTSSGTASNEAEAQSDNPHSDSPPEPASAIEDDIASDIDSSVAVDTVEGSIATENPEQVDVHLQTTVVTPTVTALYASPTQSVLAQNEAGFSLLREWASRHSLLGDPFVAGLLSTVDARQDLSAWAATSPFELLPHAPATGGRGLRRIARLLHFLRNLLVFVPVAITWLAISEATKAFGKFIKTQDEGVTVSFLEFWQSGGNGELASQHRIQHVALLDFGIIMVIIAMSLVAGLLDSVASRRAARAERQTEAERMRVALAVKRALHGKREATAESISQSLGEALTDLMNAARMVNTASLRMEAMSVGVESIGPRLDAFSDRMAELNGRLGIDLQRAIDSLSTSVSRLGGTVDGELAQTLHQVLAGLDEIRDQLGRTSASVEFGTKNLRDDLEAIHSQLVGITRGGRY